jgi:hypothetical protein
VACSNCHSDSIEEGFVKPRKQPRNPTLLELKPIRQLQYLPEVHDLRNRRAKQGAVLVAKNINQAADEVRLIGGALPGEFPAWDRRAWGWLVRDLGRCRCNRRSVLEDEQSPCPLSFMVLCYHANEDESVFYDATCNAYFCASKAPRDPKKGKED